MLMLILGGAPLLSKVSTTDLALRNCFMLNSSMLLVLLKGRNDTDDIEANCIDCLRLHAMASAGQLARLRLLH